MPSFTTPYGSNPGLTDACHSLLGVPRRMLSALRLARLALLLGVAATFSAAGYGQITSTAQSVSLTATLAESLTVSATPSSVTFTLVSGGSASGSSAVAILTKWVLLPTRSNLVLDGYFASAAAALTDGAGTPHNIPTSAVFGTVPTGSPTSPTAFTATAALGPAGAGLTLFTLPLTVANYGGTRTDNLTLSINLSSVPALPAATYTGTLILQAQAL